MAKPTIGKVTVIYPSTPEGMAEFRRRAEQVNTRILECFLARIDAPLEAKLAYIDSLDGVAPWAKRREAASAVQPHTAAREGPEG